MAQLKKGDKVRTVSGQDLTVLGELGAGGQGEVYRVDLGGSQYALKWYYKTTYLDQINARAFRENLAHNIKMGAPADQFLWPKMLTEEVNGTFGYLMDLFPSDYLGLEDFYWGKAYFPNWLAMISAALNLVEGFKILHSQGYSYQDLNNGGFRVRPGASDAKGVLICDNDNVAPDGTNLGIQGFRGFMAPEVTVGSGLPNTQTDEYSLAVVLFGLFFRGHPLEGKLTLEKGALATPGIDKIMYGSGAVFCYDPRNEANRPDPVVHGGGVGHYWPIFPVEFRRLFTKVFTLGLHDPMRRVMESEWRKALIDLRNCWVYVPRDGKFRELFVNLKGPMPDGSIRLRVGNQVVALSNGARLLACHTTMNASDFRTVTSKIGLYQQNNPKSLIMQNATQRTWYYTIPGKDPVRVEPNGVVPLVAGVRINFDGLEGEIF